MLIQKGGIFRQIDEKNLAKYKAKGYNVVEKKPAKAGKGSKPPATPETPADPKAGEKDGSNSE